MLTDKFLGVFEHAVVVVVAMTRNWFSRLKRLRERNVNIHIFLSIPLQMTQLNIVHLKGLSHKN